MKLHGTVKHSLQILISSWAIIIFKDYPTVGGSMLQGRESFWVETWVVLSGSPSALQYVCVRRLVLENEGIELLWYCSSLALQTWASATFSAGKVQLGSWQESFRLCVCPLWHLLHTIINGCSATFEPMFEQLHCGRIWLKGISTPLPADKEKYRLQYGVNMLKKTGALCNSWRAGWQPVSRALATGDKLLLSRSDKAPKEAGQNKVNEITALFTLGWQRWWAAEGGEGWGHGISWQSAVLAWSSVLGIVFSSVRKKHSADSSSLDKPLSQC